MCRQCANYQDVFGCIIFVMQDIIALAMLTREFHISKKCKYGY